MPNVTSSPSAAPHLPSPDKIVFTEMLAGPPSRARGGVASLPAHQVPRSTEADAYDPPVGPSEVAPFSTQPAGDLDTFLGTARKAAKLSLSTATTTSFADVSALIATLVPDAKMLALKPAISTAPTSKRVAQEARSVKLHAFLYAASRESDNDFHLIVGRDPKAKPSVYMTVEVSGLPTQKSKSFAKLNAARNSFKTFFGAQLPAAT